MEIGGWTAEANSDYNELFGVDKEREAATKGKPPVASIWKPNHRLSSFYWDEACEYAVPEGVGMNETTTQDQCSSLLLGFMLDEMKVRAAMEGVDKSLQD